MEDLDAVQPDIPGMTAVLRLYSQEEIDIFLQGEDMDVAVVGYFPLPETEEQMRIFKEASL